MIKLSELRYLKFDTQQAISKAEVMLKVLDETNQFYMYQDGEIVGNRWLVEEGLTGLRERVVRLNEIIASGADSVSIERD